MSISASDIKSACFSSNFDELEDLTLTSKGIHDLGVISCVPRLTSLNLAFNCLASLAGLAALPRLTSLNLSHNALTSIAAVSALPSLTSLNASSNRLTSLAGLASCSGLKDLFVHNNQISGAEELRVLFCLSSLQRLVLGPNPVTKKCDPAVYRVAVTAACHRLEVLDAAPITAADRAALQQEGATPEALVDRLVIACSGPGLAGLLGTTAKPPRDGTLSRHSSPASFAGGAQRRTGGSTSVGAATAPAWGAGGGGVEARVRSRSMGRTGRFAGVPQSPASSALTAGRLRSANSLGDLTPTAGGAAGSSGGGGDGDDSDRASMMSGSACSSLLSSSRSTSSGAQSRRPGRRAAGTSVFGQQPPPVKAVPEGAGFADVLSCLPSFEGKVMPATKGPPRRAAAAKKPAIVVPPPDSQAIDWSCKYPKTGSRAVCVKRDGSLASHWPNGDLAVTVDADYLAATSRSPGTTAVADGGPDGGDGGGTLGGTAMVAAAVPSVYRMFAAFRGTGNVAVSWDGTGGFVQYPSGTIMMIYSTDTGTGTAYLPSGEVHLRWRDGSEAPQYVDQQLDAHFGVRFVTASHRLELYLGCEGLRYLFVCGRNVAEATWDVGGGDDSPKFLRALANKEVAVATGRGTKEAAAASATLQRVGDHGGVADTMAALDNGLSDWLQAKMREVATS